MTAKMSASLRTRVMLLFLALAGIFTPVVARAERIPQTIDNENPMRLKISTVGEAVLRQQSRPLPVAEIRSAEIQQLIQHMRETMNDAPGVGLAAPQVGMPLQLVVIEDKQEYFAGFSPEQIAERERQPVPFHVIINPVLHVESGPDVEFFEGCLSLPGYTAIVPQGSRRMSRPPRRAADN